MSSQSYDLESIQNFTRLSASEQKSLLNFYSSVSIETRVKIMDRSFSRFRNVPDRHISWKGKFPELQYATFIQELLEFKRNQKWVHKKSSGALKSNPEGLIDKNILGDIETSGRVPKTLRLIKFKAYNEIKELREQGKGWRVIQEYIKKRHKKNVSHTYLAKVWKELHSE